MPFYSCTWHSGRWRVRHVSHFIPSIWLGYIFFSFIQHRPFGSGHMSRFDVLMLNMKYSLPQTHSHTCRTFSILCLSHISCFSFRKQWNGFFLFSGQIKRFCSTKKYIARSEILFIQLKYEVEIETSSKREKREKLCWPNHIQNERWSIWDFVSFQNIRAVISARLNKHWTLKFFFFFFKFKI